VIPRQRGLIGEYVGMAKKSPTKILSGQQLTATTAEKVFRWKKLRRRDGELVGKKQDKLGRSRSAKVHNYSDSVFRDTLSTNA
jgi:hypothetical protein